MTIETRFLAEHGVVEKVYRGPTTREEIFESALEAARVARAHDAHRILSDCRELGSVHTASDFYRIKDYLDQLDFDKVGYREALIKPLSPQYMTGVEAWLRVASEYGLIVKAFGDREKAIAWLLASV